MIRKLIKFAYYAFISCTLAGCSSVSESVPNSVMMKFNGKMPPSFTYTLLVAPSVKSYGDALFFVLKEDPISATISEVLSTSFVLLPVTTESHYPTGTHPDAQGISDFENLNMRDGARQTPDYHFSINIGWDKVTLADEFIDIARGGWIQGSLGLFPVTISDTIEMDIYVKAEGTTSDPYHYEKSVTYVYWGPITWPMMVWNGGRLIIGSERCIPKIEKMMEDFVNDFSKELD